VTTASKLEKTQNREAARHRTATTLDFVAQVTYGQQTSCTLGRGSEEEEGVVTLVDSVQSTQLVRIVAGSGAKLLLTSIHIPHNNNEIEIHTDGWTDLRTIAWNF
jgi:hypothetical protein